MSRSNGFISFEGVEGSGKSTQSKLLAEFLRSEGYDVVETVEPGGTYIGGQIRQLLLKPGNHMDPLAELLLYYASRAQHDREVISPALLDNKIVITDRFTDSTVAYQGHARGLDLQIIESLNEIVAPDIKPFLTILLDMDAEEGLKRNRQAQKEDRFEMETAAFHSLVRQAFLQIAQEDPVRVKVVDASQNTETVNRQVIDIIKEALKTVQ